MFNIDILFQDDSFAAINKPAGVALFSDVSGAMSFWDMLKSHFKDRPIYQVHRLDKDTSGALLIAFSHAAQAHLNRQFLHRTVEKIYVAICIGKLNPESGRIDLPLRPGSKNRFRVAGQRETIFLDSTADVPTWRLPAGSGAAQGNHKSFPSQTLYHTLLSSEQYSFLVVKPITGRSHQIRVHLSWIGHQLVGDKLYGKPNLSIQQAERMALHSLRVRVTENWTGGQQPKERVFQAPIPRFFEEFVSKQMGIDNISLQECVDAALNDLWQING